MQVETDVCVLSSKTADSARTDLYCLSLADRKVLALLLYVAVQYSLASN